MTLLDMDQSGSLDAMAAQTVSRDAQEGVVEGHVFLDMDVSCRALDTQQALPGGITLWVVVC